MPTREPHEITESLRIERVLKSSRSGIVFLARDPASGDAVAVKLLPQPPARVIEACHVRFTAFAETVAALRPKGFPALRDFGFTPDGSAYLVTDVVSGERLDAVPALPPRRALGVLLEVIDAVEALAAKRQFHGNLSPDNVLLGGDDRVWVLGLGTAAFRPAGSLAPAALDAATLRFTAPELLAEGGDESGIDARCDLYSLAQIGCWLLDAEVRDPDGTRPSVRLPSAAATSLGNPEELRSALEQSLRRTRDERPTGLDGLRRALRGALETPPAAAAAPGGDHEVEGIEWEEPEGAPAWLREERPVTFEVAPEPRQPEPRDEREDTNPVPLQRRTELPAPPVAAAAAPATPIGAPAPTPTPVIAALPPPPLPPSGPVAVPDAPTAPAPPLVPAPQLAPLAEPAMPAAPAPSGPLPAVAVEGDHKLDSTPPTGSYPLPAAGDAAPAAPPVPPPAAGEESPPAPTAPPAAEPAPTAPEAAPAAPAKPSAAAAKPAAVRPAGGRRRLLPLIGGGAGVLIVVLSAYVGLRMLGSRPPVDAVPSPAPVRPRATAVPQPTVSQIGLDNLQAAEEALVANDLTAAQSALEAITGDDELSFGPELLGRLTRARATVNRLRREGIVSDLQGALSAGNLRAVRDTLRRLTREDEAALAGDPDAGQTLDESRRAMNLLNLANRALQSGNFTQALENAGALAALVPRSSQAGDLREQAAAGIEREADTLAQRGQFERALERLETLSRLWSGRPGLGARVERVRAAQANHQRLEALLARAEQSAGERQPGRGLELLRSVKPPAYLEARFAEVRQRLEGVLREMDANPPVIAVPFNSKLEYSRNKVFLLTLEITDDLGVQAATVFLRIKDTEGFKEMALRRGGGTSWTAEITPALHNNKTVEFYATATDQSGHLGQLAGPQQPLVLKRKWSLFGL